MWEKLPINQKDEYKILLLSFSAMTELFAQKNSKSKVPVPIMNSKFQETTFVKVFHAVAEDIGNTSFDASLKLQDVHDTIKYLIGIKTFMYQNPYQKIAQFKAEHPVWNATIRDIENNASHLSTKAQIDIANRSLYLDLARWISLSRNQRIQSSIENLRGFQVASSDYVESVYHIVMTRLNKNKPELLIGEKPFDFIDINNIKIEGCTDKNHPSNFVFSDGKNTYKYTSADSQLYMYFNNENIIEETLEVKYIDDAYQYLLNIGKDVYGYEYSTSSSPVTEITESYSWFIYNKYGEVEKYSGFNSFYGLGSKLPREKRKQKIERLKAHYSKIINEKTLSYICELLYDFLLNKASEEKREKITTQARFTQNEEFIKDIYKIVFRPPNEMYIPLPNAKQFHKEHPDFFVSNLGNNAEIDKLPKDERKFNLIFEPSGDTMECFIAQQSGKGIESCHMQSILGKWIREKIFQLDKYQPLSRHKLEMIGINGIRLYKTNDSNDVHLEFIYIDENNMPDDFIAKKR